MLFLPGQLWAQIQRYCQIRKGGWILMAGQKFLSHVTTDRGITSYKQDERHKIIHLTNIY